MRYLMKYFIGNEIFSDTLELKKRDKTRTVMEYVTIRVMLRTEVRRWLSPVHQSWSFFLSIRAYIPLIYVNFLIFFLFCHKKRVFTKLRS